MSEVNVVIATCNRKNLLLNVLKNLSMQRRIPDLVIIVDSSKSSNLLFYEEYSKLNYEVIYITSNIKSAARQRNIALDYLPKTTDFFVVIDDDITFNEFFLENLIKIMAEDSIVGASGLAINPNKKNRSIKLNILKRLFLLWSPKQGSVTLSGINIPVTASDGDEERLQVEWLIGCSIWNYKMVKDLRYKSEFIGNSLFEDVIYSLQAGKLGKLIVNKSLKFNHFESDLNRSSSRQFFEMWIYNRFFVVQEKGKSCNASVAFHWTNIGKILTLVLLMLIKPKKSLESLRGIKNGYIKLVQHALHDNES